jgi:hypothetical protein
MLFGAEFTLEPFTEYPAAIEVAGNVGGAGHWGARIPS